MIRSNFNPDIFFYFPGKLYDENGSLKNWWSKETLEKYNKNSDCFVEQYSNYSINNLKVEIFSFIVWNCLLLLPRPHRHPLPKNSFIFHVSFETCTKKFFSIRLLYIFQFVFLVPDCCYTSLVHPLIFSFFWNNSNCSAMFRLLFFHINLYAIGNVIFFFFNF